MVNRTVSFFTAEMIFLIVLISFSCNAYSATLLPQTGQTKCYNSGGETGCAGTGQDGEIRAGVQWPVPRFVVGAGAQAACVTDDLTGLTWIKTPDSTTRNWQDSMSYVKTLSTCGYSDWRVPTVDELASLLNTGYPEQLCGVSACSSNASWLNSQGFSNVMTASYWSSTPFANAGGAWLVDMWLSYVSLGDVNSLSLFVWPVRGGQ